MFLIRVVLFALGLSLGIWWVVPTITLHRQARRAASARPSRDHPSMVRQVDTVWIMAAVNNGCAL